MPDNATRWTPQQKLAIETRGRNILVTASAGTGKTSVLSKRVVDILCDPTDITDVSQILVLTFTEASAEEMKSRIADELRKAARATGSQFLRHQLLLLDAAHISTIDAFCKRIITENFHILGIDPTFRIIDPDEQKLLKSELLEETVEEAWGSEDLSGALAELLTDRNVRNASGGFLGNINNVNGFLGSVLSPANWQAKAGELAGIEKLYGSSPGQAQERIISEKLNQCKSMIEHALMLDSKFTDDGHWAEFISNEYLAVVIMAIEKLAAGNKDYIKYISEFSPGRFKSKPKGFDDDIKNMIKAPLDKAKKTLNGLKELAVINPLYEEAILPAANLQTKTLLELIRRFNVRYAEVKQNLNCLDFADLEHLMLKLLKDSPQTAAALKAKFKHIFVDEYQDTNFLQQGILENVSRDNNVFVVGDIKQSIYAFRQAKPEIFLNLLKDSTSDPDAGDKPLRVDLSDNFRSRKQVLDFANLIFARIMTEDVAAVKYDEKAILKAGFNYDPPQNLPYVELNLIDEDTNDRTDGITPAQRQAAFVAERIKQIITPDTGAEPITIFDKESGTYRPPTYGDIVILMRSPSTVVNDYLEILRLGGVPVVSQSSSGYFQATEISDIISLLKLLDNPQRDIELAAVMRSPLFDFSDTDLALISSGCNNKKASFYDCLKKYIGDGADEDLQKRIRGFLDSLTAWRSASCAGSLADLTWQIYRQTGYLSFVSALPGGKQRKANLLKLHDRAIQFEGFSTNANSASLARFVEFIEKLSDENHDWAPARPDNTAEDAVRIMSVHNSKGLEFPIVFLAEINRQFNTRDIVSECLIDDENTIGLKIVDPETKEKSASIAHQVIAAEKRKTLYAEEMRILYVAITRARERLIITASAKQKPAAAIIQNCAALASDPLKDWQIQSAKSHLDWVLLALGNQKKLQKAFNVDSQAAADTELFEIKTPAADELNNLVKQLRQKLSAARDRKPASPKAIEHLMSKVKTSLSWQYPFAESARTHAKMSVSELTHRDDEFSQMDFSNALQSLPKTLTAEKTQTSTDSRQIGTATHLIIEKLDLTSPVTLETVRALAADLTAENLIDTQTAAAINHDTIVKFFQSDLGKLVTDGANTVMREWPFIYGLDAQQVDGCSKGEIIVVQGIIDMVVETADGLIIIDFKTDNVTAGGIEERSKIYHKQIDLYATAAAEILDKKIKSKHLYFLQPGTGLNI
ncbi:MAG: helicase-exonuclease AddAB subunit AddA [Planctomycetes bacterium]|nr:helicase-exonuclease AddAB subunit AddA [Planctomycetota bacterium]